MPEFKFSNCRNKLPLSFDFAVFEDLEKTKLKLLIEFDGQQHFKNTGWEKGNNKLERTQKNDGIKNEYCKFNNIKLIRISYLNYNNINEILDDLFN